MLLQEPQRTHYDLNFNLFGFPVRVHPGFLILPIVFSASVARGGTFNPGVTVLIFVIIFFLSILVHELGHTIAFRIFGIPSRVVLYWMGGLAIPESTWGQRSSLTHNQQIIVSAAGPLAGFVLAALLAGIIMALGGALEFAWQGIFPVFRPDLSSTALAGNDAMFLFFAIGLFVNIFWGLLNLAPVLPLDGGQISNQIFQQIDRRDGIRKALMLSVVTAGMIAILGFANGDQFMGIFFAIMGITNYMALQQMSGMGGGRF